MNLFEVCSAAPEPDDLAVGNLDYYVHELPFRRLCATLEEYEDIWMGRKFSMIDRQLEITPMGLAAYTFVQGLEKFRSHLNPPEIDDLDPLRHRRNIHNALSFIALAELYDGVLWTPESPKLIGGVMEVI